MTDRPATILVVDDHADTLDVTARILEQEGYRVAQAAGGTQALRLARELRPHLVLLDVVLPDISGLDVLRQIRGDLSLAGIAVVLLSSPRIDPKQQAAGLEGGADGYIARPVDATELIARVRLHLRQRELLEQLQASEERFRSTFEHAAVGIAHVAPDGRLLRVNDRLCAILGYERADLLKTTFAELTVPEDRARTADARAALLAGAQASYSTEKQYLRKNGDRIWVHVAVTLERPPIGDPKYFITVVEDIAARKLAEQAAADQAALLRIAGRTARLGGWIITLPDRTLTWSDETCVIHDLPPGYTPTLEEGINFYLPEHREFVRRHLDACAQSGTAYDIELPKTTATGREIWVRSIGEAVRDDSGRIIRLQGAFQDVSESRLTRVALQESAVQLAESNRAWQMLSRCNEAVTRSTTEQDLLQAVCRIAVDSGGYSLAWVGYADDDPEKTVVPQAHAGLDEGYLSHARITWSAETPAGKGPAGRTIRSGAPVVVPDIEADADFGPWQAPARERGFRSVVTLPLKKQSHTFGVLVLYLPEARTPRPDELRVLQDMADDLAFGIESIRSQIERSRMAETLREQASLLDRAQDAILVRDLNHRVLYWNRSAERLYGWSASEVMGRSVHDLLYKDPAPFLEAVATTLAKGEWAGELEQVTRDGTTIAIEGRWTLVRDDAGKPKSILAINTDITQRKQLEQQYLRAQRMESIGTLAGGIAHDLNNVLAPILMSIELLQSGEDDRERLDILSTIEGSAKRGAAMVRQVLSFARGMEGQRVEVRLQHVVDDLGRIARDTFPKNIAFEERLSPDLWTIQADPTQVHQVLINLCVNARDAMPDGGRITIRAENHLVDEHYAAMNIEARVGPYAMIAVEDTGTGIARDIADKIFDPFFTTKDVGKGTGLGLATSMAIVKSHGGFIRVDSAPGAGACFRLYLPATAAAATAAAPGPKPRLPRGNGETVLVVDDEASIRTIARQTLEGYGYRVLLAADGAEAVALFSRHQAEIDVVLTDMMMPVMDGAATIEVLTRMNPCVRIIGASGLAADGHGPRVAAGALTHFLPKPYTALTLLTAIRSALRPKSQP